MDSNKIPEGISSVLNQIEGQHDIPQLASFMNGKNWLKLKILSILALSGEGLWVSVRYTIRQMELMFRERITHARVRHALKRYEINRLVERRGDRASGVTYTITRKGIKRVLYLHKYQLSSLLDRYQERKGFFLANGFKIIADFVKIKQVIMQIVWMYQQRYPTVLLQLETEDSENSAQIEAALKLCKEFKDQDTRFRCEKKLESARSMMKEPPKDLSELNDLMKMDLT
jgi:hypothetical protein